jgi:hypothetical protein
VPDNAIYYQIAYGAIVVLLVGYAFTIRLRRRDVARKREASK